MANDAHEAKRARWLGDFVSVNGGSFLPVPILINFNGVEMGLSKLPFWKRNKSLGCSSYNNRYAKDAGRPAARIFSEAFLLS